MPGPEQPFRVVWSGEEGDGAGDVAGPDRPADIAVGGEAVKEAGGDVVTRIGQVYAAGARADSDTVWHLDFLVQRVREERSADLEGREVEGVVCNPCGC